jgi:hypothetical protein
MRCTLPVILPLSLALLVGCAAETQNGDDIPEGMTVEVLRPLVLTEEARVPENDAVYDGVEVHDDRLVFLLSGELAEPLAAGHVVAGRGDGGYLREITSVGALSGGRLEVSTIGAQISQFLADGHFRVHYDPPDTASSTSPLTDDVAGRRDALGGDSGATILVGSPTGLMCGGGSTSGVTLTPEFSIDPSFDAELDVGLDWGWTGPRPKINLFRLTMGAEVYAGIDIESENAWSVACVQNLPPLVSGIPLPTVSFAVLGIPVIITNEIEPTLEIEVAATVSTDTYAQHMSASLGLEMGVEYSDGEWRSIWEPTSEVTGGVTATDDEGAEISLSAKLSAGLEYQARLYGQFGPNFGFNLFVEKTVGTTTDFCEWNESIDVGAEATFAGEFEINVGPVSWEVAEIEIASIELIRLELMSDTGSVPWCDGCTSSTVCIDDLGREICSGGTGVLECGEGSGYYQACTCTASGLVDCGTCSR